MTRIRKLKPLLLAAALFLFTGVASTQDTALVRFVHLGASSPSIDIRLNGELSAADLRYGETSAQVTVPAGPVELSAFLPGTSVALFHDSTSLEQGPAAIILTDDQDARLHIVSQDLSPLPPGSARLALLNTLDANARVAVIAADETVALTADLAKGAISGHLESSAGTHEIRIEIAGDELVAVPLKQALAAGSLNLLILHGTPAEPKLFNAAAATQGEENSGRLRFIHAIEGAAPVDLRLNGQLLLPALSFAQPSPHIALPAGTHDVAVNLGSAEITSIQLQIRAGEMRTVVLMRAGAGLGLFHFADATANVDSTSAVVSVINAIPNSVISHLQMESGAIIGLNVQANEAGDAVKIIQGRQAMTLHLNIAGDRGEVPIPAHYFFGGAHYTLVALAGSAFSAPRMLIAETNLQRRIAATPALDEPVTAGAPASETEEPPDEAFIDQPATAPDAPRSTDARQPSLTPFATVNVNDEAALHMRQYPSSQALSLGLLPAQSDLMILGRRGPTESDAGEAVALPLDLGEFVDAAAALQPWQDLSAADTWLYAMYSTPDDGALYGWVNAMYLEVFDQHGERQRLASLSHVRQNQPGSAYNTDIRPPELADRITARVHGLHGDALLNLRRSNDAASEILSQIPPDESLRLIGLDAAENWAFVEYQPQIGNHVRGWVSMLYVQLLLNGQPVQATSLRAIDPSAVPQIGASVAGAVQPKDSAEASPAMEGIVGEVNVNFDSALHLRRYPDATSESLALIPTDTALRLKGVTQNGRWYKVIYAGEEGWVAAPYLVLSMNGRKYARAFLEGQLPRFNDLGF